ncbi:hypothetical protein RB195_009942 [Necator americanus]|uniref:Uncharacterized protein n=1 Tax=Necator americanus TaxID=51031 RepID=A0ABR1CWT8_NECAM
MEMITERFYSNVFFRLAALSSPFISAVEALPRILPSEVRVAIKSMKPGAVRGFDINRLPRGGGHPFHVTLAASMTSYRRLRQLFFTNKKGDREQHHHAHI